jgi:hypothetical protein
MGIFIPFFLPPKFIFHAQPKKAPKFPNYFLNGISLGKLLHVNSYHNFQWEFLSHFFCRQNLFFTPNQKRRQNFPTIFLMGFPWEY